MTAPEKITTQPVMAKASVTGSDVKDGSKKDQAEAYTKNLFEIASETTQSILSRLSSSMSGLTPEDAETRLDEYGKNEVATEKPPRWYVHLFAAMQSPFIAVLLLIGLIALFTRDLRAAIVVFTMVSISVLMTFFQEFRASQAAEKLRHMVSTNTTVIRNVDGKPVKSDVPLSSVVPGDIVFLSAGDMVPADVIMLTSKDLFVSQSVLTGESMPVEKFAGRAPQKPLNPFEFQNVCFMGTNVVSGTGTAIVYATGNKTYFGSLAGKVLGYRVRTSFEKGINSVTWLIIRFMLVMAPLVLLINGFTKGDWWEAALFALSVAVGLTPEMLPMVVTSNLGIGALSMSRKKVIVKRLNSIQNFGSMDILCTDKTGTITENKVALIRYLDVHGKEWDRVLKCAYLNSYYQTGLKNLLDVAVLEYYDKHPAEKMEHKYRLVDEIPFDFVRRRMSVVLDREDERILICKGAVEELLSICDKVTDANTTVPLTDAKKDEIQDLAGNLNVDGLRVLAIAYKDVPRTNGVYSAKDEVGLTLIGFVAFLDPAKATAANAIKALIAHGVEVKILTGDNDLVTRKICKDVGMSIKGIALGDEIETMSDDELAYKAENTTIFAKLTPLQKSRVIKCLKDKGHTVGFLGDGVNDAAALKEADVGISVDSAVDIAKESADIILLENSLMVLEEGIVEGRRTFGNILKYIKMTASSNFGNTFSILGSSALLPFLPIQPIQLLVQNLLYDFSQLSIPFDSVDKEFISKPQKWDAKSIGRFMLFIGPISSIFDYATYAVLWFVFSANTPGHAALFNTGWFVEGLLSQTLIVHMLRTQKIPFIQRWPSKTLMAVTSCIMIIGIALPFTPIGEGLGMVPLPLSYFPWLIAILLAYCVLAQTIKSWYIKKFNQWL